MQTDLNGSNHSVVFLYKLINGASEKSYGPHVAKMAGLPEYAFRSRFFRLVTFADIFSFSTGIVS